MPLWQEEYKIAFKGIKYNAGEYLLKIKVEDESGRFLENWVIMSSDLTKWVRIMNQKYGFIESKKKDKDLDWAK